VVGDATRSLRGRTCKQAEGSSSPAEEQQEVSTQSKPRNDAKIVIERAYRADIQDVWDLWTTKEGFESWWGPQGFRVEVHELVAQVGGSLRYDMIADSPEMIAAMQQAGQPTTHATRARFTALVPRERLVITNVIDFLPGVAPYESNIA